MPDESLFLALLRLWHQRILTRATFGYRAVQSPVRSLEQDQVWRRFLANGALRMGL